MYTVLKKKKESFNQLFNQLSFMSPHQLGDFPVTNTPTEHVPELTSLIRCVWAGELPNCVKFQTYRVTEWLLSCMTRFSRPSLAPNSECSTPSIGISWYYRVGERLLFFFSCNLFSLLSPARSSLTFLSAHTLSFITFCILIFQPEDISHCELSWQAA